MFKPFIRWAIRHAGYEMVRRPASNVDPIRPDITGEDARILAAVRPFTLTSPERLLATIDAVRYVVTNCIPGAIVECGVWKGGNMMAAAYTLMALGITDRELYLYDTFSGMSEPTGEDRSYDGATARDQLDQTEKGTGIWCHSILDEVRINLSQTGYPGDKIRFVQGKVEDTIPRVMPDRIAVLRLDTDWYESTRHELQHLSPRLTSRGLLIIDDYGHWQGARKATDEYFTAVGVAPFLHRIDYTGRIAQIP